MKRNQFGIITIAGAVVVALTGTAGAHAADASSSRGHALRDIVTPQGVFTVRAEPIAMSRPAPWGGVAGGLGGWFYDTSPGIGNSVAISPDHAWGAVELNEERLAAFTLAGSGTPIYEFFSGDDSPAGVAAARDADRAAYLDEENAQFRVHGFTSASSTPDWTYEFAPNYAVAVGRNVAVSRDGSVVAAGVRDSTAGENFVVFFDAETGDELSTFTSTTSSLSAIDLTDDGSRALISLGSNPRVVDTSDGSIIWSGSGSGAGNVDYRISGDGNVVAVGGFDMQVFEWDGSTYVETIDFTAQPLQWFGFGLAVSRDGSTVGSMARASSTNALYLRMWDVESGQMLGEVELPPVAGSLQTALRGADASDDGSRFAFATWGDGTGVYPEVLVYDRDLKLIGEIDMPGSAYDVAMSGNGQWVTGTGKAVHANDFGNGGQIETIELEVDGTIPGDLDGDGIVDGTDLALLLGAWGACADCDNCPADLDGNCEVDGADLAILLGNWS